MAVPSALRRIAPSFRYVSLDIEKAHIQLQRKGAGKANVEGLMGDATRLPLRDKEVDIFIFHHAIDDVLETRGSEGLMASLEEATTALKTGGCMIFSHSVFTYDLYTLKIDLTCIQDFLQGKVRARFQKFEGPMQTWLLVEGIQA